MKGEYFDVEYLETRKTLQGMKNMQDISSFSRFNFEHSFCKTGHFDLNKFYLGFLKLLDIY